MQFLTDMVLQIAWLFGKAISRESLVKNSIRGWSEDCLRMQ
jgi:hypothetical protein